jgi:hypothetical protein
MKAILKKSVFIALFFVVCSSLQGCYMFKKKNRCGDCPKWNKIELQDAIFPAIFNLL